MCMDLYNVQKLLQAKVSDRQRADAPPNLSPAAAVT